MAEPIERRSDYVRASSLAGAALQPTYSTKPRSRLIGRSSVQVDAVRPLPRHISHALWARRSRDSQPGRLAAMLQYLVDVESFLSMARDRLSTNAVLGIVIGDPEMRRSKVPLTKMVHDIAKAVGFSDLVPPVKDRIRRRFQAVTRRDSNEPISHETLLCLTPN